MTHAEDAIFEHEMFNPESRNTAYKVENIRKTEATWDFNRNEIEATLSALRANGLVAEESGFWRATLEGKKVREKRWQELGLRHTALTEQAASLVDLILAIVVSGGETDRCLAPTTFPAAALNIYLHAAPEAEIFSAVDELIGVGLIEDVPEEFRWTERDLVVTAEGEIHYSKRVVPSFGLQPPKTILSPLSKEAASSPFKNLGFDSNFTGNLQFRWEEAARCRSACAWLAVTVLYGSILEAVLLASLAQNSTAAMASPKRPKGSAGSLDSWSLEALLNVAADINLIEPTLATYGHALRDTRNLIHPQKQMTEKKYPDEMVAEISSRVVHGVINSLSERAPR